MVLPVVPRARFLVALLLVVAGGVYVWSPWQGEVMQANLSATGPCAYDSGRGEVVQSYRLRGAADGATTFGVSAEVFREDREGHLGEAPAASGTTEVRVPDGSFRERITLRIPLALAEWDSAGHRCLFTLDF